MRTTCTVKGSLPMATSIDEIAKKLADLPRHQRLGSTTAYTDVCLSQFSRGRSLMRANSASLSVTMV